MCAHISIYIDVWKGVLTKRVNSGGCQEGNKWRGLIFAVCKSLWYLTSTEACAHSNWSNVIFLNLAGEIGYRQQAKCYGTRQSMPSTEWVIETASKRENLDEGEVSSAGWVLGDCDLTWKKWQHWGQQGEVAFRKEGMQLRRQACSWHIRGEGVNVLGGAQGWGSVSCVCLQEVIVPWL